MKAIIEISPIGYGIKDSIETSRVENRPEGITIHFIRGFDERTHRPNKYDVTLTPAVRTGSWKTEDDRGEVEQLTQKTGLEGEIILGGIWVETGERRTFKAVLTP